MWWFERVPERPFLGDPEFDVACIHVVEHCRHDLLRAERADQRQWFCSPVVPGSHEQVTKTADVVEVVVGDEDRIEVSRTYSCSCKLCGDTSPRIEEKSQAACLDEGRGALASWVRARTAGSEKCDAHTGTLDARATVNQRGRVRRRVPWLRRPRCLYR